MRTVFRAGIFMGKKITIYELLEAKQARRKITAVSCYDYTTASLAARAGVEMVLVGDSAAQVVLGYDSTLPATMDFMVELTAGVRRASQEFCLVADMPFLSYHTGLKDAVLNAGRFVSYAGAQIVKIEVSAAHLDVIRAVSDAGIAVMAHIGIRPQSITKLGRLKAEGTTAELAYELLELSKAVANAGAGAVLLEGTAREVSAMITKELAVPVIGCGSGPDCDGQILVIADLLGLSEAAKPKFAKSYAALAEQVVDALSRYAKEVREGVFPNDAQCYHIKAGQMDRLRQIRSAGQQQ